MDDEVDGLASAIGCKQEQWPIKYLGVPLGGNLTKLEFWAPVISKMSTKLASWKKAYLSRGGRLTLIKSVLSALPTYFMSIFKVPTSVAKQLEALMRNFLWDGADGETHYHVVNWDQVRFRRGLNEIELEEYTALLGVLESVSLSVDSGDVRVWLGDSSGVFSVSSFYSSFFPSSTNPIFPYYYNIWKFPIPQKVKVFSLIVALGKLKTCDNLQRRRPDHALNPQWCYLCKKNMENQDHILLHCAFTTSIWTKERGLKISGA
ncbi:uncharacterized protein LOC142520298 [Primulina tabacum]|uniref:uncharacterized protein LOC142520298 n=1 Tax=Primulina tabacum TaxID=48773 RepID=UPI003F5A9A30